MRLSHLLIAGATAVSFSVFAAGEQQAQQQGRQTQQSQQTNQNPELVKQAQQKLSEAGHEVQADGIMGPKTQAALKEFQQQKGLRASGQLDQETLAALGVNEGGASTGATGASKEPSSAGSSSGAGGKKSY